MLGQVLTLQKWNRDEVTRLKDKSTRENISADGLAKMESFVQGVSTTMTKVHSLVSLHIRAFIMYQT